MRDGSLDVRMTMLRRASCLVAASVLFGCATTHEPEAERVQLVTPSQKEKQCQSLGIFNTEQRGGPDKLGSAMNKAVNEVSRRGGNGIYVVSNSLDWAEGAS